MAENKLDQLASDLVDEMIKLGRTNYVNRYTLTGAGGKPIDEDFIIVVYRGKKGQVDRLSESTKSFNDPIAMAPVGVCPRCGGSGRA